MRVSKKTDYALRALFTLVDHYGGAPIPIRELARRNDIMTGLRGGYVLSKNPSKITMGEVVRHFDGILAPIGCVSVTAYKRCSQEPVCRFRRIFLDARNYVTDIMERATLAEVAKGSPVSKQEVSTVFIGGDGI